MLDILSMYRAITYSYQKLPDKTGIEEWATKFPGFDGNEEARLLGYCRWYCESDGGKFKELDRGDDFNSHAPLLPAYRRMLAEWEKSNDKNHLTQMDIIRITNAMTHPDHKPGPGVH